jgi:hypothetical protein
LLLADDALVTIFKVWGKIEVLAFGKKEERWAMGKYVATSGLRLRVTEEVAGGVITVIVLCVSSVEYKAWLPGEKEPRKSFNMFSSAVCDALGVPTYAPKIWKNLSASHSIFDSTMTCFLMGRPIRALHGERFHVSSEGNRLRPSMDAIRVTKKAKKKKDDNDDFVVDDEDGISRQSHYDRHGEFEEKMSRVRNSSSNDQNPPGE